MWLMMDAECAQRGERGEQLGVHDSLCLFGYKHDLVVVFCNRLFELHTASFDGGMFVVWAFHHTVVE